MKKNNAKNRGFTLVELALVMLIFGMIITTVMFAFKINTVRQSHNLTIESINDIRIANATYAGIRNKYPCPAPINANETDIEYGAARCDHPGVKRIPAERDANEDGDPNNDFILIGAVPFKTLMGTINYTEFTGKDSVDGWGNKIIYAVTENLSERSNDPFNGDHGAINVFSEFPDPDDEKDTILDKKGTAHIVLVSHGENGVGAYTAHGQKTSKCTVSVTLPGEPEPEEPVAGEDARDELENCDHNDDEFLSGLRSENKNNYNDDIVRYQIIKTTSLWEYADIKMSDNGTPWDPADDFPIPVVSNTNIGFIGVGIEEPKERLHVAGDVLADEVRADQYCDGNGQNCLNANSLAGSGMNCSGGNKAVVAIAENQTVCADIFQPQNLACNPGEFMVGISNKTGAICAVLP